MTNNKRIYRIEWSAFSKDEDDEENDSIEYVGSYSNILNDLVLEIKKSKEKFDYICGIPRGGLIPAVQLSHILEIPYISLDKLMGSYAIMETGFSVKCKVILVDDICHSGDTIRNIFGNNDRIIFEESGSKFMVLVQNEVYQGNHVWKYGKIVDKNTWVKFPWENEIYLDKADKMIEKHLNKL